MDSDFNDTGLAVSWPLILTVSGERQALLLMLLDATLVIWGPLTFLSAFFLLDTLRL